MHQPSRPCIGLSGRYWRSKPSCASGPVMTLIAGSMICSTSSVIPRSCWSRRIGCGATRARARLEWTARPPTISRPSVGCSRVGTRRGRRTQQRRRRERARLVITQQMPDGGLAHHRLNHCGQSEPEDQRPQDLPGHRSSQAQRVPDRGHVNNSNLILSRRMRLRCCTAALGHGAIYPQALAHAVLCRHGQRQVPLSAGWYPGCPPSPPGSLPAVGRVRVSGRALAAA